MTEYNGIRLIDQYSKKSPGLFAERQIKGFDVVEFLNYLKQVKGCVPALIHVDNGSEFISNELDRWAYEHKVVLDFSRPGKPTDNPYIESLNGKFRDKCLSVNWFLDPDDARQKTEAW